MPGPIKVLVVDDEDEFRNNMVKLLGLQENFEAKGAASGEAAVDAVKAEEFNIVLLDVKMPGLTAVGTLERLKELGCQAEVIILTGHASVDDAVQLMNLGAYDYLLKPCSTKEIVKKITWALENKRVMS